MISMIFAVLEVSFWALQLYLTSTEVFNINLHNDEEIIGFKL